MTDKEKIIAYIDKLLEKYPKNYYLLTVAEFIDSLQEEPTNEDFEKEVEKMWAQEARYRDTDYTIAELTKQDYEDCARHFANWQKQQDNNACRV